MHHPPPPKRSPVYYLVGVSIVLIMAGTGSILCVCCSTWTRSTAAAPDHLFPQRLVQSALGMTASASLFAPGIPSHRNRANLDSSHHMTFHGSSTIFGFPSKLKLFSLMSLTDSWPYYYYYYYYCGFLFDFSKCSSDRWSHSFRDLIPPTFLPRRWWFPVVKINPILVVSSVSSYVFSAWRMSKRNEKVIIASVEVK